MPTNGSVSSFLMAELYSAVPVYMVIARLRDHRFIWKSSMGKMIMVVLSNHLQFRGSLSSHHFNVPRSFGEKLFLLL